MTRLVFGCLSLAAITLSAFAAEEVKPPADSSPAPAVPSLLSNGDFAADTRNAGTPDDWGRLPEGVTWEQEDGARFLRFQSSEPGKTVLVHRSLALPSPAPPALEIRARVRYQDIQPGSKQWFDGRIMANFKNAEGKSVKARFPAPAFRGTSKGWVERSVFFEVPEGATTLEIMPCLFQAKSGTLDIASIEVFPARADQVPPPPPPPPFYASEPLVAKDPKSLPPELRVEGNKIVTVDGKEVWLQGLCLDSMEWAGKGEKLEQSVPVAIEQWKSNVIRLPVRDDFWFGTGPWQKKEWGGLDYRKEVDSVIEAASARGAYVVLDLHRFGPPMERDVKFWKDAATRYKNHPAVLFELFNEPHSISWPVWQKGGSLDGEANKNAPKVTAENQIKSEGETSVGMQALVDAVRSTGARNIVIAGGIGWGYDISGVLDGYALEEKGGNGIVYSSHVYPWKKDWQKKFLDVAEKYPLFIGELGAPEKWEDFAFIPVNERYEDLAKLEWPPDMLGLIQKHKLHWTGFSFHPRCGPMVISDWNYTPTPYWGIFVKEALAGKQFEMKRMR